MYAVIVDPNEDLEKIFRNHKDTLNKVDNNKIYKIITCPNDCLFDLFLDWEKVYNLPLNKELRQICPNPNFIQPGMEIRAYKNDFYLKHDYRIEPVVENYHEKQISSQYVISFDNKDFFIGNQARLIEISSDIKMKRLLYVYNIENLFSLMTLEYKHTLASFNNIVDFLKKVDWGKQFYFYTRNEFQDPNISYNIESLFKEVYYNNKECYWIFIEPARFFMDIDFYPCDQTYWKNITIEDILEIVRKYCEYWLVTETLMEDGKSPGSHSDKRLRFRDTSYNIFTDKIVTIKEAINLEEIIIKEVSQLPKKPTTQTPIGDIFHFFKSFAYRRSPYAKQKWWPHEENSPKKKSVPRLDLSHLPKSIRTECDIFQFSYPNQPI